MAALTEPAIQSESEVDPGLQNTKPAALVGAYTIDLAATEFPVDRVCLAFNEISGNTFGLKPHRRPRSQGSAGQTPSR